MLTEEEIERIDRIYKEAMPTDKRLGMRIYADDALFIIEIIQRLLKRLETN